MVFKAAVTGGSGGYGVFVGTAAGVRKVVAHGDAKPTGGTFAITSSGALSTSSLVKLNNAGQVAFLDASSIYVSTPASGLAAVVTPSSALPAPLDSRSLASIAAIAGFNDHTALPFAATLTGTSVNNSAVLRAMLGNPIAIVAYRGQGAPGTSGQTFDAFSWVVMNGSATSRSMGRSRRPRRPAGCSRCRTTAPCRTWSSRAGRAPGGGLYGTISYCRLLTSGSVHFECPLATARLATGRSSRRGGLSSVVRDGDPLPDGSRQNLRNLFPRASGRFVGFIARRAGGHLGLLGHDTTSGVTHKVVADGDFVPAVGAR